MTAVAALIFTALSLQVTREQAAIEAQGEVTGRFTAAVSQLGSPMTNVQIGAIYALGSIAHDSAYEQPAIVELLSDFIRENTGGSGASPQRTPCSPEGNVALKVVAALNVLGHRDPAQDGWGTVNLAGSCLDRAQLSGMEFPGAIFDGAFLEDAFLDHTDLDHASLSGTSLISAGLTGAQLVGASLDGAALGDASPYDRAILNYANLQRAFLDGADLENTCLVGANLNYVVLDGANFTDADLDGASFAPYPSTSAFMKATWVDQSRQFNQPNAAIPCIS